MVEMKIPFDYDNATEEERKAFQKFLWEHPEYDNLDEEEQWYEDHFDEFVPCEDQEEMRRQLMEAAKRPPVIFRKNPDEKSDEKKPVSLRLGVSDISRLKSAAKEQGLPYQSLIGSILHRYVCGTLVDISEVKKVLSIQSLS